MKQLWAPWRIEYIKASQKLKGKKQKANCFLCIKNKRKTNRFVLYKGEYAFVMMNQYPYNPGHLMIAPFRHIGLIEKLKPEEAGEMFRYAQECIGVLKRVMRPDGFNIGLNIGFVAGAGVPGHLHLHIVPRWQGDTNFMPVISDTKIINEMLAKTYCQLQKAFFKKITVKK